MSSNDEQYFSLSHVMQVSLTVPMRRALGVIAKRHNLSMASLIRAAIHHYMSEWYPDFDNELNRQMDNEISERGKETK